MTDTDLLASFVDRLAEAVAAKLREGEQARLMTVRQVADYLGRSERSVRQMIADGALPVTREGRTVRVDRRELDRWIEMRRGR